MTRLTPEERRLLEQEQATQEPRQATPAHEVVEARAASVRRRKETSTDGVEAAPEHLRRTPVQYQDDGWDNLPVQMRGE